MIRLVAAVVCVCSALLAVPSWADDHDSPVHVSTTQGGIWAGVTQTSPGTQAEPGPSSNAPSSSTDSVGEVVLDTVLHDQFCAGVNWTTGCVPTQAPPTGSTSQPIPLTPGTVANAFRSLPLPASSLEVQPPNGQTLVNFDTNFFTRQGQFTRTVRLLGQRVDLKIWPSQYRWVFGDGESLASESAGAPYPDLVITHDYRSQGGVRPRVDTTYSAQFRVNGGAWRDVDGTVTIPGDPVDLRVRTATPVLVGYN